MLSDVLFAIDNPMNMENFSLHSNISYNSCLLEGFFSLRRRHVLLLFANLLHLYVCSNADGCVGVGMFDGCYVCVRVFFFFFSLCGNSLSLIKMADSHLSIEAFNRRWVEWCLCTQTIYTNIVSRRYDAEGVSLNSMNMLLKKAAQISRSK